MFPRESEQTVGAHFAVPEPSIDVGGDTHVLFTSGFLQIT